MGTSYIQGMQKDIPQQPLLTPSLLDLPAPSPISIPSYLILYPFLGRSTCLPLVPLSMPNFCGYMNYSLVIIDLKDNAHI